MKKPLFPHVGKSLSRSGGVNAGLVIGYTGLTLVVARAVPGGRHQILAWARETYGSEITRSSPGFPAVLKAVLDRHLAPYPSAHIWCMIQSKGVETRFLVLPDVPPRHLPAAAFWTFKKEVTLNGEDIVFDFDVTGARETQGKKELEIMACSAPVKDLQELKALFKTVGYPLRGITVTSFAFQNLFRTGFAGRGSDVIGTLFIGTDWSRIDIFDRGNLVLSRDIKTGTRSMTEVIDEQNLSARRADISIDAYLTAEEDQNVGAVEPPPDLPVHATDFFGLIQDGDQDRLDQAFDLVRPVVDRLIRQIERTFEHFSMTASGKRVERLYFTGPLCAFGPLLAYTQKQLNIPVSTISPFRPEDEQKPRDNARIIDDDEFVPATGLALSGTDHTLNFNFTYTDKVKRRQNRRLSRGLGLALALAAAGGLILHWGMSTRLSAMKNETESLSRQAATRSALYGKPRIMDLSGHIDTLKSRMGKQAEAHRAPAILAELTRLLSGDIRLTAVEFRDGGPAALSVKGLAPGGDRTSLDRLVERLENSPLIHSVVLAHVKAQAVDDQPVHYFEMTLELK
ncbi:hypothetical protein JCM14469_06650 [Desulfatiferula olefinivorans]